MRTKSEAKREAILDVATQVFREEGFERTTMSEICNRVGGSKATIYNYFPSKEDLFFEIMFRSTEAEFEATHLVLDPTKDDIAEALRHFGEGLLTLLNSPDVQAARRLIAAESGRSGLGRLCYERGPKRGETMLSEFLQEAMNLGKLKQADPMAATRHLRALLEFEWQDRSMYHLDDEMTAEQIKAIAESGVDVFMAAYGPNTAAPPA